MLEGQERRRKMTYENVVTIVSPMAGGWTEAAQKQAMGGLKTLGIERLEVQVLDRARAVDIYFSGAAPVLQGKVLQKIQEVGAFDVFVQRNDGFRKKKLLMADMDATMVVDETLDEVAAHFGLKDQIAPITARAMRGEIDFAEALRMRVILLKGKPVDALEAVAGALRYSPGAGTLVRTMNKFGARCILISGGFDMFTGRAALTLGFFKDYANRLGMDNGRLTGEVMQPIVDKNFKKKTMEDETRRLGIDIRQVMAVGDGANDIPMLQAAGVGVGYFAKPAVQAATPYQVRYTDLTALLYLQGYRREEFAA